MASLSAAVERWNHTLLRPRLLDSPNRDEDGLIVYGWAFDYTFDWRAHELCILIHGPSWDGRSTLVRVYGFYPFLYIQPPIPWTKAMLNAFIQLLDNAIHFELHKSEEDRKHEADGSESEDEPEYGAPPEPPARSFFDPPAAATSWKRKAQAPQEDAKRQRTTEGPYRQSSAMKKIYDALAKKRPYIRAVHTIKAHTIFGYQGPDPWDFVRITLAYPTMVPIVRRLLEDPHSWLCESDRRIYVGGASKIPVYEANIDFMIRFLVERNLIPSSWYRIKKHDYTVITDEAHKMSYATLEVATNFKALRRCMEADAKEIGLRDPIGGSAVQDPSTVTPNFLIMGYDGEMQPYQGHFPKPERDPILQFSFTFHFERDPSKRYGFIFALGEVAPDPNIAFKVHHGPLRSMRCRVPTTPHTPPPQVFSFATEKELLRAICSFRVAMDPDIETGYNNSFDEKYIRDRCAAIACRDALQYTRVKGSTVYVSERLFKGRKLATIKAPGRVNIDMLNRVREEMRLKENTLWYAAYTILEGITKEDMQYSLIEQHQKTAEGRRRLAIYCDKDGQLPPRMLIKRRSIVNYIQMSRVNQVPVQQALDRGQQFRVMGRLMWHAGWSVPFDDKKQPMFEKAERRAHAFLIPTLPRQKRQSDDEKYEGALVIPPLKGFYLGWRIAVLDVASLYPTIIIMHNVCYSTFLTPDIIRKHGLVRGVHYWQIPNCVYNEQGTNLVSVEDPEPDAPAFLDESIRRGILPEMEILLKLERAKVNAKKKTYTGMRANVSGDVANIMEIEKAIQDDTHAVLQHGESPEVVARLQKNRDALKAALAKLERDIGEAHAHLASAASDERNIGSKKLAKEWAEIIDIYDALQNQIKTFMNSIYGFTGAPDSPIPLVAIAATITKMGRYIIMTIKFLIETIYGGREVGPAELRLAKQLFPDITPDAEHPHYTAYLRLVRYRPRVVKDIIYGDTDSVMVRFDRDKVPDVGTAIGVGTEIARTCSTFFSDPKRNRNYFTLEMEKIYENYLLLRKKGYAGKKWMVTDFEPKFENKGLDTVKRGTCTFIKDTLEKCLDYMVMKGDVKAAIAHVQSQVRRLLSNEVSVYDLFISKQLSKPLSEYNGLDKTGKPKSKGPHVRMAELLAKRNPDNPPTAGDRIQYMFKIDPAAKTKGDRVEDPMKMLMEDIPIDNTSILELLATPLARIFFYAMGYNRTHQLRIGWEGARTEVSLPMEIEHKDDLKSAINKKKEIADKKKEVKSMGALSAGKKAKKNALLSRWKKEIEQLATSSVLQGEHTRTVRKLAPGANSPIGRFLVVGQRCMSCSASLAKGVPDGRPLLCDPCFKAYDIRNRPDVEAILNQPTQDYEPAVCASCETTVKPYKHQVYTRLCWFCARAYTLEETLWATYREKEEHDTACWTRCAGCPPEWGIHDPIEAQDAIDRCMAAECDNKYARTKARKDKEKSQHDIQRFCHKAHVFSW